MWPARTEDSNVDAGRRPVLRCGGELGQRRGPVQERAVRRKILVLCIDAFGPDYLRASDTPALDHIAATGSLTLGRSVIPSVTNVNNVSLITGAPPRVHGITSNYHLDPASGREDYMESPDFLRCDTLLQRAQQRGMSTALLTSKEKLLRLLGAGADYALAAEEPDAEMIRKVGPARDIYSAGINVWLLKALRVVLRDMDPDVVYCATTDYMMHKHAPESGASRQHMHDLDAVIGDILQDMPGREVYVTADHGMSAKRRGVDVQKALAAGGIAARALPIIKDRYVAHHSNLGGSCYVYLGSEDSRADAISLLEQTPGIEQVLARVEAAAAHDLAADRIGDLFVLGDQHTVCGEFETVTAEVNVRSHGSRHEGEVPILVSGGQAVTYQSNYDVVAHLGI